MLLQIELASNATHFRAQALPHTNGVQEFRYFQHWADVSASDAASTFASSGNEILHITGMGFDPSDTAYECVFTSITHTSNNNKYYACSLCHSRMGRCRLPRADGPCGALHLGYLCVCLYVYKFS